MPRFSGLAGLYAIQVVSSFDNALVLPSMYLYVVKNSKQGGISPDFAYGVAQTVYFVCRVFGQLAIGRALDRGWRYRVCMSSCLALGVAGSATYASARDVTTIVVARGLLGLGSSVSVASLSFVSSFVAKEHRTGLFAKLMGLSRASTPIAPLVVLGLAHFKLGPVDHLNSPGIVVGLFNLAALFVVVFVFAEPLRDRSSPADRTPIDLFAVLRQTGAWVSYVLSFQNNWNNQVVVWTLPLITASRFGPSPTRDAFLFASGGLVGLCTAFGLSRRKLCSTDRATIVVAQLGVGCVLAAFSIAFSGCLGEYEHVSLAVVWLLFSFYYAPFVAQMPANNAMYSKLISDHRQHVGLFQSVLEVSKSSARALAGLVIGKAYATTGPCLLWMITLTVWLAQFLPVALMWNKLDTGDSPSAVKTTRRRNDVSASSEVALVDATRHLPPLLRRDADEDEAFRRSLRQGFVSPPSPVYLHFAVGGEVQML